MTPVVWSSVLSSGACSLKGIRRQWPLHQSMHFLSGSHSFMHLAALERCLFTSPPFEEMLAFKRRRGDSKIARWVTVPVAKVESFHYISGIHMVEWISFCKLSCHRHMCVLHMCDSHTQHTSEYFWCDLKKKDEVGRKAAYISFPLAFHPQMGREEPEPGAGRPCSGPKWLFSVSSSICFHISVSLCGVHIHPNLPLLAPFPLVPGLSQ